MKSKIRLEVLPLYRCNQKCNFCMFRNEHNNENTLSLAWLDENINQLKFYFDVIEIRLSGGEVSLLSELYFELLYYLCKSICKKISVETNLYKLHKSIVNYFDVITVGYNFNEYNVIKKEVFENIKALVDSGKIINIKTLDISCFDDCDLVINRLNSLRIKSWEIIPYQKSLNNCIKECDYSFFENVISKYLRLSNKMNFAFQNKLQLDGVLDLDNYNTLTVYITPNNKFAIQNYDKKDNFSLLEVENIQELVKKCKEIENFKDKLCEKCTSKLKCMANRFLNLNYTGLSCCGCNRLINAYKK